jgi:Calpain family cysteine protease
MSETIEAIDRDRATTAIDPAVGPRTAVINPYALAEVIVGRRINWAQIDDKRRLLEDILQTPYEELFDPKYQGPLYLGFRLNEKLQVVPERSPLLDVEVKLDLSDLEVPFDAISKIERLSDLGPRYHAPHVGTIPVERAEIVRNHIILTLRLPDRDRLQTLARVFTKSVLQTVAADPRTVGKSSDWTPPDASWGDAGRFFNESTEFFDPIQGAVANCYYIAALSAVAWAMPYRIRHLTRATGQNQDRFTNLIQFFKPDTGGQLEKEVEVTDTVPLNGSGNFLYARSSEAGEIWPAIYEKAYAKLKTGITGDHPDILATAWGDCVWATAQLTGGHRAYYDNANETADKLWDLVRANSMGGRTVNPMTAWTYGSGDEAPKKVIYADANVVGSHCYTVLGWDYRDGRKYIILRNPWGNTEATVQALTGTTWLFDVSWWRPISLAVVDGTFAVEASAFKQYWAGLGVAK